MEKLSELWQKQWVRYVVCVAAGAVATTLVYPSISSKVTDTESIKKQYEQQLSEQSSKFQEEQSNLEKSHQAELSSVKQESSSKQEELSRKLSSMTQENSNLRKRSKVVTVEIVHPDGTIERRSTSTEEIDLATERVAQVQEEAQQKLKETTEKLEQEHKSETDKLKSSFESQLAEVNTKLQKTTETLEEERSHSETVDKNQRKLGVSGGINSDGLYKVHGHYTVWGPVFLGADVDTNGKEKNRAAASVGINF
jgi:chromosome segregation ATPase